MVARYLNNLRRNTAYTKVVCSPCSFNEKYTATASPFPSPSGSRLLAMLLVTPRPPNLLHDVLSRIEDSQLPTDYVAGGSCLLSLTGYSQRNAAGHDR